MMKLLSEGLLDAIASIVAKKGVDKYVEKSPENIKKLKDLYRDAENMSKALSDASKHVFTLKNGKKMTGADIISALAKGEY